MRPSPSTTITSFSCASSRIPEAEVVEARRVHPKYKLSDAYGQTTGSDENGSWAPEKRAVVRVRRLPRSVAIQDRSWIEAGRPEESIVMMASPSATGTDELVKRRAD